MEKEKKLVKDFFIYFIGSFASKILVFILLPLYTNYLSKKEYGEYDLLLTTVMLLEIIINLKIPEGLYRWLLDEKFKKEEIISIGLYCYKRSILIFSIFYIITGIYLNLEFIKLFSIYIFFFSSISITFSQSIIRGFKKNKFFSFLGMIETIVFLILNIFFITKLMFGINGIIYSKIVSSFVWIIPLFIIFKNNRKDNINKNILKNIIIYSLPLVPSALSWWGIKAFDRYCINYFLGADYNGIYAVANKFPGILLMLNNIFYLSWQENSITSYNTDDRDKFYTNIFNRLKDFQLSICIVLIPFIKILCVTILGESYKISWKYAIFLIIGSVFSLFSSFYAVGYLNNKKTINVFKSSLLGVSISIILNILFMKKYGLQVASISTMISFFIVFIYRAWDNKKYFTIKIEYLNLLLLVIILSITITCTFLLDIKKIYVILFFNIIISLIINRQIIFNLFKKVREKFEK